MTERLYYTDSHRCRFDAIVESCDARDGRIEVVLDRTAFYPPSGGQPFDTGRLGEARVVDVFEREDGAVVHVLDRALDVGASVRGDVDWLRRFDHIQQHTGQHLLSAAFEREFGVATVSFHLGADASTIDLAREVTPAEIRRAEAEANQAVWRDRPVTVRFTSEEEAARLPLRKDPARAGVLRLIEVSDFDLSACGGTHATRTGEIGIVAVTGWERFKGGSRLGFVCGGRALTAFGRLRDTTEAVTRQLSVGLDDLAETVERLQGDAKARTRLLERLQERVVGHQAAEMRDRSETMGPVRVVLRREPDWDARGLRALALAVVAEPGVVAVLVGAGDPAPVVVARSADVGFDAGAWMKRITAEFGGRGGGRPDLAQGGVKAAAATILDEARAALTSYVG
jgi:alanyl-tRNA synthetase